MGLAARREADILAKGVSDQPELSSLADGVARLVGRSHIILGDAVVGAMIAVCVGFWGWRTRTFQTFLRKNKTIGTPSTNNYTTFGDLGDRHDEQRWFGQYMVLSLDNLRQGRYYTLVTYSFTHFAVGHLAANMFGLWRFGPKIVDTYGITHFFVIWVGSSIAGGLLQAYHWSKTRKPNTVSMAIGASCSTLGLLTAYGCTYPNAFVRHAMAPFYPIPIRIALFGLLVFDITAFSEGWLPEVGHLGHIGGMLFGAFWWKVALDGHGGRFYR